DATNRVLKRAGYEPVTAANGVEAVSCYAQRGNKIAAVLTDLMMPVMDGLTMIRVLRQMNPHVKIIACSAFAGITLDEQKLNEFTNLGINCCLTKPYTGDKLLLALHQLLHAE